MSRTDSVHVVIGAGQVGAKLAAALLDRGHRVRLVRRGGPGAPRDRLEWRSGDITEPSFADDACRGAAVVYNCTNPPYHRWHDLLPPLSRAIVRAAARAGARLVVLDNLYMYGRPAEGAPLSEDTPYAPCSRKGELRARLADELFAAHARGDVRAACGRAPDFFGPDTANASVLHPRAYTRLRRGRPVEVLGDPDMPHAYAYTPDVAAGLATLGEQPLADGRVWHLPVAWRDSTRALVERFAAHLGTAGRVRAVPRWLLRALGLFAPQIGGVAEMVYQWESPFIVDDSRFRAAFAAIATPIDDAIAATLGADPVSLRFGSRREPDTLRPAT